MGLKTGPKPTLADRHVLYEAAVQSTDFELDLVERIFRTKRRRTFRLLREDFCGTAALAVEWVRRRPGNLAIGVDLHRPTLEWGIRNHEHRLGKDGHRLRLICADVLEIHEPKVDVVVAFNYSYQVFKERDLLRRYFRNVHRSLTDDGIFVVDAFGGTDALTEIVEERKIPASVRADGTRVPAFTYVWEQVSFNPVDHRLLCRIHFKLPGGHLLRNAFRYDWRLWTLPELQELMREAGFRSSEFYMDGWDEETDEPDNIYRRRTRFENVAGWLGYVVGIK